MTFHVAGNILFQGVLPPCAPSPPLSSLPLPGIETFTVSAVSEASPAPFQLPPPRQNTDSGYLCPLLPCWPTGDYILKKYFGRYKNI